MGQKFQYDESGSTFFYFLLSFLALVLVPATYFYWPRKPIQDPNEEKRRCHCQPCQQKRLHQQRANTWKRPKNALIKFTLLFGWFIFLLLAYKVSQFDYEMVNFDPYEILGVSPGAPQSQIKRAYHKLSLILHPDKDTGSEKAFMKLSKAYQALTDEEARRNWERYGNPDGPGAMSFGIALPSWIVEKKNSVWVLGLYALVFMVALPVTVGTWWYRSIKFTGDQVLLDTTQMYYYFFHRTPTMPLKRVIMILGASLEFDRRHNSEICERQSDNEEVPQLIKRLSNLNEKNKERPLCFLYSIKARAIIHAHLSRYQLNANTLDVDRCVIVAKCPYLIQEQVNCVNQLILMAYNGRISKLPNIETIENCMKLCPMIVQGMWDFKSPLLQLPFITDDSLKFFMTKKRQIRSLQQFAQLARDEQRPLLRGLSDMDFESVLKVLGQMPLVDFACQCEVMDDENPTEVTAGAIVTVTVTLTRTPMSTLFNNTNNNHSSNHIGQHQQNGNCCGGGDNTTVQQHTWLKTSNKRKGGGGGGGGGGRKSKTKPQSMIRHPPPPPQPKAVDVDDDDDDADDVDNNGVVTNDSSDELSNGGGGDDDDDDDEQWEKFKKIHERDKALEGKSKVSHTVHCPYFPLDKQEYWWTYICDRKSRTLLTVPYHVTSLMSEEIVHLKFTAPIRPGVYTFTVCLRSDSYLGFDQQKDIKLDVKQAPAEIKAHPQWEFEDSEEERPNAEREHPDSEYTTDDDIPDDADDDGE